MRLYCVGDSLTYGAGVRANDRWTDIVERDTGWQVTNYGLSGDTTSGMLMRMQTDVLPKVRLEKDAPSPCVFIMGGYNDVFYSGTSIPAQCNMGTMIHEVISAGGIPIIGIPPLFQAEAAPSAWKVLVDFCAARKCVLDYCAWLERCCCAFNVACVDFRPVFLNQSGEFRSELFFDGIHPGRTGHRLMAQHFIRTLNDIRRK